MKNRRRLFSPSQKTQGQGLVEFALILPLLALLLVGVIEMGFAMYDYITLASANREGVRLASRARFTDNNVVELVVSSSGLVEQDDGTFSPNMILFGEDANLGVIVTHVSLDVTGSTISNTTYISGTIIENDGTPRFIQTSDTRLTQADWDEILAKSSEVTRNINTLRESQSYDTVDEEMVVVETFLAHDILYATILPFPDDTTTITLYFRSIMRVIRDSRL